jgi:hypothetical protein
VPDWGVFYTLPRIVGAHVANQLAFSTGEFDAQQVKAMGIAKTARCRQCPIKKNAATLSGGGGFYHAFFSGFTIETAQTT